MKAVNRKGIWGLIVRDKALLYCKECKKSIAPTDLFYFCSTQVRCWCYDCRTEGWTYCQSIDKHEHYLIKWVEEGK